MQTCLTANKPSCKQAITLADMQTTLLLCWLKKQSSLIPKCGDTAVHSELYWQSDRRGLTARLLSMRLIMTCQSMCAVAWTVRWIFAAATAAAVDRAKEQELESVNAPILKLEPEAGLVP
eukprot:1160569-Pelagomonas_calceolata.AAC.9